MARKRKPSKQKPEGGTIRMGPIVLSKPEQDKPRKIGGVVIMGPIGGAK